MKLQRGRGDSKWATVGLKTWSSPFTVLKIQNYKPPKVCSIHAVGKQPSGTELSNYVKRFESYVLGRPSKKSIKEGFFLSFFTLADSFESCLYSSNFSSVRVWNWAQKYAMTKLAEKTVRRFADASSKYTCKLPMQYGKRNH